MKDTERVRRMLLDVVDDCKETPPEQMRIQLLAAGWTPVNQSVGVILMERSMLDPMEHGRKCVRRFAGVGV